MIYWKYKFKFGKTTEEKFKYMQDLEYRVRSISYIHYLFLTIIKWVFGVIFIPIYTFIYIIQIVCSLISLLLEQITDAIYKTFYD